MKSVPSYESVKKLSSLFKWIASIVLILNGFSDQETSICSFFFIISGAILLPPLTAFWSRVFAFDRKSYFRNIIASLLFLLALFTSKRDFFNNGQKQESSSTAHNRSEPLFDANGKEITVENGYPKDTNCNNSKYVVNILAHNRNFKKNEKGQQKLTNEDIEIQKVEKSAEEQYSETQKLRAKFEQNCLSAWNGSCNALVSYVKDNMNDPSSFEHIETKYLIRNNYAIVIMKYRGKNALGALVLNQITAKVNYDCNVIDVMEIE